MRGKRWLDYLGTPLVGAIGGAIAMAAHWPLPWMIGSLVAVILVRCFFSWQLQALPGGRKVGQWVIGIGIGLHFTPNVVEQIFSNLAPIAIGAVVTAASSFLAIWILRKSGEDEATAYFSSMPGGSAEMVNLGSRNGADLSRVAAAQSLRVLAVVLIVPALFKFFLGEGQSFSHQVEVDWPWLIGILVLGGLCAWALQAMRQPNSWLFGPLLVSTLASVFFDLRMSLPPGFSQVGQLLIGSALGCYFDRSFFRHAPAFLSKTFVTTLLMMLITALAAGWLGWSAGLDYRSLALGMMPGGIAEMSLTAETLQLSVPLVTAMQVTRLFLVLFLAEPIFRRWQRVGQQA